MFVVAECNRYFYVVRTLVSVAAAAAAAPAAVKFDAAMVVRMDRSCTRRNNQTSHHAVVVAVDHCRDVAADVRPDRTAYY